MAVPSRWPFNELLTPNIVYFLARSPETTVAWRDSSYKSVDFRFHFFIDTALERVKVSFGHFGYK